MGGPRESRIHTYIRICSSQFVLQKNHVHTHMYTHNTHTHTHVYTQHAHTHTHTHTHRYVEMFDKRAHMCINLVQWTQCPDGLSRSRIPAHRHPRVVFAQSLVQGQYLQPMAKFVSTVGKMSRSGSCRGQKVDSYRAVACGCVFVCVFQHH